LTGIEKKLFDWLEKNILVLAFLFVTVAGIAIRYSFRELVSNDAYWCLIPWYNTIKENGGFAALGTQVGDYNMLYQFIIAIFTYLPIEPLSAYKLLSSIFDFLLAGVMGYFVYGISDGAERRIMALLAYSAVVMSPLVFLNSSYWGQCDAIFTFFCIASLCELTRDKYKASFILYGVAFAFKFQAVFLLPFYLFIYVAKKTFSAIYFLAIPLMMVVLSIPGFIAGRSVIEVFTIYMNQTGTYRKISLNYPSFWNIFCNPNLDALYLNLKRPAMAMTVVILALIMIFWLVNKVNFDRKNMIFAAFILTYTCVLFLPAMHERYGYLYEILALLILFINKRTWPLVLVLYILSFVTYGSYLFPLTSDTWTIDMSILSVANVVVYSTYLVVLNKEMLRRK
jgi:Gpi18-like mannosyltransferase